MISRRDFLRSGVTLTGAGALLPGVFQKALAVMAEQRSGGGPADNGRVLVVVQMAGGNDGLNTVVPISDGRYYSARPEIAIQPEQALPLDARTGLNPSLARLKELWDARMLAVVEGIGYPSPNFSHFVSMDIWQTADPGLKLRDGWLGRCLERTGGAQEAPFLGLAVGRSLPMALRTGALAVPSLEGLAAYQFQGDPQGTALTPARQRALMSLYRGWRTVGFYGLAMDSAMQAASASVQTLQAAHQAYKPAVQYPEKNSLAPPLLLAAEAIASNTGVKICHVSIGGFDNHANQLPDHARQLGMMSDALHAFYSDLKAHGLDSKIAIMTWSEFGRRVKGNASSGTDHGSAGPVFFLGTPIKGGLYGQRPDLGSLDNGNLRYTVDFRSVYATALDWLGAPTREILGAAYQPFSLWA